MPSSCIYNTLSVIWNALIQITVDLDLNSYEAEREMDLYIECHCPQKLLVYKIRPKPNFRHGQTFQQHAVALDKTLLVTECHSGYEWFWDTKTGSYRYLLFLFCGVLSYLSFLITVLKNGGNRCLKSELRNWNQTKKEKGGGRLKKGMKKISSLWKIFYLEDGEHNVNIIIV